MQVDLLSSLSDQVQTGRSVSFMQGSSRPFIFSLKNCAETNLMQFWGSQASEAFYFKTNSFLEKAF